jgi:hypothetical protein
MLGTSVEGMEYNYVSRTGRLYMARGCCCDMQDCINFFRRLDPDVQVIRTIAGIEDDTRYCRLPDGRWQASLRGSKSEPGEIDPKGPTVEERFARAGIEL